MCRDEFFRCFNFEWFPVQVQQIISVCKTISALVLHINTLIFKIKDFRREQQRDDTEARQMFGLLNPSLSVVSHSSQPSFSLYQPICISSLLQLLVFFIFPLDLPHSLLFFPSAGASPHLSTAVALELIKVTVLLSLTHEKMASYMSNNTSDFRHHKYVF